MYKYVQPKISNKKIRFNDLMALAFSTLFWKYSKKLNLCLKKMELLFLFTSDVCSCQFFTCWVAFILIMHDLLSSSLVFSSSFFFSCIFFIPVKLFSITFKFPSTSQIMYSFFMFPLWHPVSPILIQFLPYFLHIFLVNQPCSNSRKLYIWVLPLIVHVILFTHTGRSLLAEKF